MITINTEFKKEAINFLERKRYKLKKKCSKNNLDIYKQDLRTIEDLIILINRQNEA